MPILIIVVALIAGVSLVAACGGLAWSPSVPLLEDPNARRETVQFIVSAIIFPLVILILILKVAWWLGVVAGILWIAISIKWLREIKPLPECRG